MLKLLDLYMFVVFLGASNYVFLERFSVCCTNKKCNLLDLVCRKGTGLTSETMYSCTSLCFSSIGNGRRNCFAWFCGADCLVVLTLSNEIGVKFVC